MRRSSPPDLDDPDLAAAVARVHDADLAEEAAEAKAAFHLRMRARGIRDLAVLRAFELVPRRHFVPHRYLDLAARDLALPIDCGQTLAEPWLVATMIEALAVERAHRVLEIGSGTGYATIILAQLAAEVIGLERFRSLALGAAQRLTNFGVENAAVVWEDGLAVPPRIGPFERIIVHAVVDDPAAFLGLLVEGGRLVCGWRAGDGQVVAAFVKAEGTIQPTHFGPCRLSPLVAGLAAAL